MNRSTKVLLVGATIVLRRGCTGTDGCTSEWPSFCSGRTRRMLKPLAEHRPPRPRNPTGPMLDFRPVRPSMPR